MSLNQFDAAYHSLLKDVRENGRYKLDRTGVGCYSVFGRQVRFDLSKGFFPLITTKFVSLKTIAHELLWFLSGDTNNNTLRKKKVGIWNAWAYKDSPEIMGQKYKWLKKNDPLRYSQAKVEINTVSGAVYNEEEHLEKSLYVIDTLYRAAGGPELTPEHGSLGPVYGAMWRAWPEMIYANETSVEGYEFAGEAIHGGGYFERNIDQMQILIDGLKNNPFSRRHIVSGWNPALLPDETKSHRENVENGKQVLPPCHTMFQFFVEELTMDEIASELHKRKPELVNEWRSFSGIIMKTDDFKVNRNAWMKKHDIPTLRLSCQLYQRSADVFLGVPYNIASYSLLLMMVAQATGMAVGEFVHTFGDLHVYANHLDQVDLQLSRDSKELPIIKLNPEVKDLFSFEIDDIINQFYDSHPAIKGPVAV